MIKVMGSRDDPGHKQNSPEVNLQKEYVALCLRHSAQCRKIAALHGCGVKLRPCMHRHIIDICLVTKDYFHSQSSSIQGQNFREASNHLE
jgi:hypothetical protein